MRRVDIGVGSYGTDARRLEDTLASIEANSQTDWRCFIIHNPSDGDGATREAVRLAGVRNSRFVPVWLPVNCGYAGAVCNLMRRAETEYLIWCDNDIDIRTPGWDEVFCKKLDGFHEIGMIFPNGGAYEIERGDYVEVMWGVGFCFALNRLAIRDTGVFDTSLGHQEEADYALRLRMAGWRCAALREVCVAHAATSTNNPAALERINAGVRNWVDKWNRYFNGKHFNYHSVNVTRWDDWPPNALYLEEWYKLQTAIDVDGNELRLADLNTNAESVFIRGNKVDLILVPRFSGLYRHRII